MAIKRSTNKTKTKKSSPKKSKVSMNAKAQWHAYKELQAATEKAWEKLRMDIQKKAPLAILVKDSNALNLLLGECNYMTREYMSMEEQAKK